MLDYVSTVSTTSASCNNGNILPRVSAMWHVAIHVCIRHAWPKRAWFGRSAALKPPCLMGETRQQWPACAKASLSHNSSSRKVTDLVAKISYWFHFSSAFDRWWHARSPSSLVLNTTSYLTFVGRYFLWNVSYRSLNLLYIILLLLTFDCIH